VGKLFHLAPRGSAESGIAFVRRFVPVNLHLVSESNEASQDDDQDERRKCEALRHGDALLSFELDCPSRRIRVTPFARITVKVL
jgi:hypothetical protein